jgi:hypothetical protein
MENGWLRGRRWMLPTFIDYCYLIGHRDLPWLYRWEACSHFWIWPDQRNLASFFLQRKSSSLLVWALPSRRAYANFGPGERLGRCYQQMSSRGISTRRHLVISPQFQSDDIFSLFSKFFQHLAHLNDWSSSASFDIWCSLNRGESLREIPFSHGLFLRHNGAWERSIIHFIDLLSHWLSLRVIRGTDSSGKQFLDVEFRFYIFVYKHLEDRSEEQY